MLRVLNRASGNLSRVCLLCDFAIVYRHRTLRGRLYRWRSANRTTSDGCLLNAGENKFVQKDDHTGIGALRASHTVYAAWRTFQAFCASSTRKRFGTTRRDHQQVLRKRDPCGCCQPQTKSVMAKALTSVQCDRTRPPARDRSAAAHLVEHMAICLSAFQRLNHRILASFPTEH